MIQSPDVVLILKWNIYRVWMYYQWRHIIIADVVFAFLSVYSPHFSVRIIHQSLMLQLEIQTRWIYWQKSKNNISNDNTSPLIIHPHPVHSHGSQEQFPSQYSLYKIPGYAIPNSATYLLVRCKVFSQLKTTRTG